MQQWLGRAGSVLQLVSTKSSDLLLALFIVSVIALMILPLPILLIDTLVAANIALGIMLVMMGIYVTSPLQFSVFPSILLISTLFRLALSVSTTRMILLQGEAGHIIDTFGNLVAGGNVIVGLVVFLIITLVQFLVIAKGSERVAEVGARFTLDAMPGKQLSIDSDLRSGLLDKSEARRKRADLETESQLHGSLDGAMKFVKGDSIAGIVIIIINLLGGLGVGVFQLGMATGDAMQKYSILTIGDGLVAQIPALFGAMAAGLIVTRVSKGDDSSQHLGEAISSQFTAIPRVIIVAGGMCLLFAAIPGFPTGVFLVMGIIMVVAGAMLIPAFKSKVNAYSGPAFDKVMNRAETVRSSDVSETTSVTIEQSSPMALSLPAKLAVNQGDADIRDRLDDLLSEHFKKTGIKLPNVQFKWHREEHDNWWLDIYDVPVVKQAITGQADQNQEICDGCLGAIRRNMKLFVGLEETAKLLARCSDGSPEVVREIQRALPLQGLSVIVKNLAEEEVPINNLAVALESLVEASQNVKDLANLTEFARISLGRQICNKYAVDGELVGVGLAFPLEEKLLAAVRANNTGSELNVSPVQLDQIANSLRAAIEKEPTVIVAVPVVLRRHIRGLISESNFDTPVLSYPEIAKPFNLRMIERIDVSNESGPELGIAKTGSE